MLHFREGQRLHHQQRLPPEPDERDGAGAVRRGGQGVQGGMLTGLREDYFLNPWTAHGVPKGALIVTDEEGVVKG